MKLAKVSALALPSYGDIFLFASKISKLPVRDTYPEENEIEVSRFSLS